MPDADVIRMEGRRPDPRPCAARTADGRPCRNRARDGLYCGRHADHDVPEERSSFEAEVQRVLAFARRRMTGSYPTDDFGFDQDLTENVLLPLVRPLFERWWRVEQRGMDNIPAQGSALLVANHSGGLAPWDALMMKTGIFEGTGRHCRLLAADLPFRLPFIGQLARKGGNTVACEEDAKRLLENDALVGVFPEGYKGIGKPFRERYRLQRFGRGGFAEVALATGTPIIPVAIVGAEEIHPVLGDIKPLARLLGLPYFPVTPTFPWLGALGTIPLPTKWIITYGEPIETKAFTPDAAMDPMFVFNLTDQVRESIQQTLYRTLMSRKSIFG